VAIKTAAQLLERERELSEFGKALTEAQDGRGQFVLVEAPAGLGKTSLLRAASETAAEAGFTCLRARASELERDFAYGCVRQLLESTVAKVSDAERDRLFEGAAALSKPLFAPTGSPLASPSADSAFSMRHGLYWLLNNLAAEGPVALLVDDLHWSDTESLRFLAYLAPRLDGLPLAVVASTRSAEGDTGEVARLAASPETTVLRPGPLSVEATATLCEHRLGADVAPEFVAACREATGGNPFFLEALLREAAEQNLSTDSHEAARVRRIGPAVVAQAVLLRLSGRPAEATALVRAVAVLGDGTSLAEVAGLAELSEEEAAHTADLLITLGLLKPADGLEFAHPIVREAVYADIGSNERAEAHARAARILTASGASEERIAAQIAAAEPSGDPDRVELLRRVGADALARGAPASAVALLRRALAEPPPPASSAGVLLELGSAELRLAAPGAVDHLTAAVELIREPGLLAMAVLRLANALTNSGDADRAVEAIESAIELVEPHDRERALLLEAELAAKAQVAGLEARGLAARRLARHGGLAGATAGERLVLACLAFERARASESATEAAARIERALARGPFLGEQELDVVGPFYLLMIGLLATEALDLAAACLEQALADAQAQASIPALAFVLEFRGWVSLRRGAVAQAEADARTALELLTAHDIRLGDAFALALLIEALIEGGELDSAERALGSSGFGAEIPPGLPTNDLLEARALLHLARGRRNEGLDELIEFGRRDELWGAANPLASRWRSRAALALAAMGDSEGALRMVTEDLERARRWGAASGIGVALRAAALVEAGQASVDRLREAADVLERSPARLEHARALTDLGAALRRANQRAAARHALHDGLELAQRCGARALAERARIELRAAGGRSSGLGTGVEQLTVSERRVAELAADGHSNPEIAQALFVTRKTVETHLGRVYRKLDISGRAELPRALAEESRQAGD
jgi:DNA-binding CsgD family transcriptional regulator